MRTRGCAAVMAAFLLLPSCKHTVEVEPLKIEPIHLTIDLNVHVDRKLDEFFAYEEVVPAGEPETVPDMEGPT